MDIKAKRKERNRKFFNYMESCFTAAEYKNLDQIIGASPNRVWRLSAGEAPFQLKELIAITNCDVIKKSVWEIIQEYGVGADVITLDQINQVLNEEGNTLGIVSHAA